MLHPRILVRALFCALGFLSVTAARAQILFTVNGTATSDDHGYTADQAYTVSFLLNPAFDGQSGANSAGFDGTFVAWYQSDPGLSSVFTDVSGSAVHGAYVSGPGSDPDSLLNMWNSDNNNAVSLIQKNGTDVPLGLQTLDDAADIVTIQTVLQAGFAAYAVFPVSYVDPTTYWRDFIGTHPVSGTVQFLGTGNAGLMTFNVTDLTVTDLSAVPEPSTYAAFAGAAACLAAAFKRRRAPGPTARCRRFVGRS
jgi:hypothetical protein